MITGAGLPRFNDAVLALRTIESVFSREFREDQLETYQSSTHHNYPSIEASNRYFSTRKDIPSNDFLHLPTTIDPRGYLKELQYQDLIYTADNVVEYYEAKGTSSVQLCQSSTWLIQCIDDRMVAFDPAKFRLGDIVEAQLSFMAIPVRNKYRMRVILRSIALVNNEYSEVSILLYVRSQKAYH